VKVRDQEPELRLLLEDYPAKRSGPRRERLSRNGPARPSPQPFELSLLVDDFPRRAEKWRERQGTVSPFGGSRQHALQDGEGPRLLIEDYDPGGRYLASRPGGDEPVPPAPAALARATADEPHLDLEVDWPRHAFHGLGKRTKAVSLAAHLAVAAFLITRPQVFPQFPTEPQEFPREEQITILAPPSEFLNELTQPEPPQGPKENEFRGLPEPEQPVVREPAPAPAPQIQEPPEPEEPPGQPEAEEKETEKPAPAPEPEPEEPEPPQTRTPAASSPNPGEPRPGRRRSTRRRVQELPMPKAPKEKEKPQLVLEDPGARSPGREGPMQLGSLKLNATPGELVQGAIEQMARGGTTKQAVGDTYGTGGLGGNLPPSPGNAGSNLELLSDPQGVDFRPYLMRILSSVRRNWYAVIPESARLGMERGVAKIQFIIERDGNVSKLVIADSSGAPPLDRAAVAGISASLPFPPLPIEYGGNDVRLQFSFRYNIK